MLYLVLPVHNREAVTSDFLDMLLRQDFAPYTLIIVDDGCTDNTVATARSLVPDESLVVLKGDGNLWWGGALHMAWKYLRNHGAADGDAVLILNDDVTFSSEFLTAGMVLLQRNPNTCIQAECTDITSRSVDRGVVAQLAMLRFRAALRGEQPNCLSTRGLLMRADAFVNSGGFRPNRLPHYLSDYEFTLRMRRHGMHLMTDPSFSLEGNSQLTGTERYGGRGLRQFWSRTFSNRAKFNPIHWSAFILLACPVWVVPAQLSRVWARFGVALAASLLKTSRKATRHTKDNQ